ncbi:hypothetical protein KP509_23G025300 [Ceratopteris richardii]|uniref:Ionotropic glutamate receptor L-glutamate and glycine-binding domain-containing protein n=1 Tax=Ceratopteris richardii TaxID=49495 RepID=A0A8T2S0Q2_CERRI|nr:hypothetical protein KP509_23G025300 [Ceratopteris richardii]
MNKVLVSLVFCACCSIVCSNGNKQELDMAARCKNILMSTEVQPRQARGNDTLRVVVPWATGYREFVKFDPETCMIDGFSVQVFLQALRHMERSRSSLRYQFVVHGTGDETPDLDEMIDMLVNKAVDIVVADLTITRDRAERVPFTFPYLPSSLVMVTPFSYGSAGTIWDFAKPFSTSLWITLLFCFLVTGFALYILEYQNPDFSITSKKRNRDNRSHGSGSSKESQSTLQYSPRDGMQQGDRHIPASHDVSHNTTDELSPVMLPEELSHVMPPGYNPHPIVAPTNDNNVMALNDASSIQPLGASIYDQASHARRFTNAYWFTSMCVFQTQHLAAFRIRERERADL